MGKSLVSLLITLLLLVSPLCPGQIHTVVSHPVLEFNDQEVHIFYDIINSGPNDRFSISVLITDTHGQELNSHSLSGDVGENVSGGVRKHIVWDLGADSIALNGDIDVQILLEALPALFPGSSSQNQDQNELMESDPLAGEDAFMNGKKPGASGSAPIPKNYSRTGLVFQSLVFPGWGLSRIKKKPHWIKGLAAYGCVTGAVYMNRRAVDTYGQIDRYQDYQSKDDLYQEAMKQDNISELLAYTAAGIWVVDFVWTLVGSSELKTKRKNKSDSGLSLITDIDPITYAPMLGLHISF